MANDDGLRERKKRATRDAISDVATRLFNERGFDAVTVAEVAEAANVSKMTVFNYFPRKEDLFFDRGDEGRALVVAALERRPSGQPPILALRALAHELAEAKHPFAKFNPSTARFWKTVEESEALLARARELRDAVESDLAAVLAGAADRPRGDPDAAMVASILVGAWRVAYVTALRGQKSGGDGARTIFLELLDRAFVAARAAMKGTPYV